MHKISFTAVTLGSGRGREKQTRIMKGESGVCGSEERAEIIATGRQRQFLVCLGTFAPRPSAGKI